MLFYFYIFGEDKSTYFQFPEDGRKDFLNSFCTETTDNTKLSINRKASITDYLYCKKLNESSKKIGMCISLNKAYFNDINTVLNLFETLFLEILSAGKILQFDNQGNIEFTSSEFSTLQPEIERLNSFIDSFLESEQHHISLQNENFCGNIGYKNIDLSEGNKKILACTEQYNFTNINVGNNNNLQTNKILQTITKLNKEKEELQEAHNSVLKQKKQYKWVMLLSIMVIICLIGLYFLNNNLSNVITNQVGTIDKLNTDLGKKEADIRQLNDTLTFKRKKIEQQNILIANLEESLTTYIDSMRYTQESINTYENKISSLEQSISSYTNTISSLKYTYPILITDIKIGNTYYDGTIETNYGNTIYNWNTMYLTPQITYKGIYTGKNITLKIKWYKPDGTLSLGENSPSGFSQQTSLYTYSGTNTIKIGGWGNREKGHWKKGTYRIEIWYNEVCLKAKTFSIQ